MKKIICCLLAAVMCLGLMGCSEKDESSDEQKSENRNLYKSGLDVIALMQEKASSRNYLSLTKTPEEVMAPVQGFAAVDVEAPIAVYEVVMPKTENLLEYMDSDSLENYNALSPQLQEEIDWRMIAAIPNDLLAKQGYLYVAAGSILATSKKISSLNMEKPRYYLYLYESGMTVMVTFSADRASGSVVTLNNEIIQSDILEQCEDYGFKLKRVKVK